MVPKLAEVDKSRPSLKKHICFMTDNNMGGVVSYIYNCVEDYYK